MGNDFRCFPRFSPPRFCLSTTTHTARAMVSVDVQTMDFKSTSRFERFDGMAYDLDVMRLIGDTVKALPLAASPRQ